MKQHQRDTSHTPIRWAATVAILLLIAVSIVPATAEPLPQNRHIFVTVANDAGVKYDLDGAVYGTEGNNNTYYIKADGGGLNELHITADPSDPYGQVTTSGDQSGTFYVSNTGGRGFDDTIVLLLAVNGTIPDDFAVHIRSSGYDWTPNATVNQAPTNYTYVEGALDETFTKEDFIYGPQTWKPGPGMIGSVGLPLYEGHDVGDTNNTFSLMFIDLSAGNLKNDALKFPDLSDEGLGAIKVEYSFENLETFAALNAYGWCLAANQAQGISWTNRLNPAGGTAPGSSGYSVIGIPPALSTITIDPATTTTTMGETLRFTPAALDQNGRQMKDVAFDWASSDEAVGTINESGYFTALEPGMTTVTASHGAITGSASVTVIPPQGDQTQDAPLDIPGCTVTTGNDGKSQVSINTSGTGARVAGNTITIPQTTYTLTIETENSPLDESGDITGTVATIRLDTKPIITGLGSLGTINASVSANLTGLPTGASLTTTVSQDVSPDAQSAFQLAAGTDGLNLDDVAYTMNIARTNLENGQHITGATIRMAVSPAWVADHGADAIRIIRVADDGTKEVLATRLVGTDADGNQVFEAASPNGFSVFGLAAVSAAPQATQSSSSGGGGGHTSTAVDAASNLKPGESVTLSMDQTAISAVTVTASNEVKDVMVTMAKGSLPQAAEPPADRVYQYIEATLYKAAEEDLGSIQFRFAVPNNWFAAHGCTAGQIALFRYTADEWREVPVEVLGEENGGAVFVADPDGFGLFAIAATGQAPSVTEDTTPEPTATEAPVETVTTSVPTDTTPATQQTTPQATPLPVWAAVLAFGVLLLVRRT